MPQVLYCEPGHAPRPIDVESDLFPHVDWTHADLDTLAARLPKDRPTGDHQLVRLRTGADGLETERADAVRVDAIFDAPFAVRSIADIVPNSFAAWALVEYLLASLRLCGWGDASLGANASFIVEELRKELATERDAQAAALFAAGLDGGTVQFALRGGGGDWRAPATLPTAQPDGAPQLCASNGGALERSLFLPIYKADLNDAEQSVAVYLDRYDAVRWWHRNGTGQGSYGVRGWRRGNVYPDFLIAAVREGAADRVVVLETKGDQLAGNHDTEYKRALLDRLTVAFRRNSTAGNASAPLPAESFTYGAAVVLFGDLGTRLPSLIKNDAGA